MMIMHEKDEKKHCSYNRMLMIDDNFFIISNYYGKYTKIDFVCFSFKKKHTVRTNDIIL